MARIVKEGQRGYDEHAELKIEFTHDQGRKTLAMTGDRIERFLSLATYPLIGHTQMEAAALSRGICPARVRHEEGL